MRADERGKFYLLSWHGPGLGATRHPLSVTHSHAVQSAGIDPAIISFLPSPNPSLGFHILARPINGFFTG